MKLNKLSLYETRKNSFDVYTNCSQQYIDTIYSILTYKLDILKYKYVTREKCMTSSDVIQLPLNEHIYPIYRIGGPIYLDFKRPEVYTSLEKALENYLSSEGLKECKITLYQTMLIITFPWFESIEREISLDEEVIETLYNL